MATALWSLACLACLSTNIKISDIAWKAWLWRSWITAPFHHWLGEPSSLDPACQCVRMLASCILHFSFQRASIQLWKWPCTGHEDRTSAEVRLKQTCIRNVGRLAPILCQGPHVYSSLWLYHGVSIFQHVSLTIQQTNRSRKPLS